MGVTSGFGAPIDVDQTPQQIVRSVYGRVAADMGQIVESKLRAARRCSDCVHFGFGTVDVGGGWQPHDVPEASCARGRFEPDGRGGSAFDVVVRHEDYLRECLRTAATCDDFEAVSEGE